MKKKSRRKTKAPAPKMPVIHQEVHVHTSHGESGEAGNAADKSLRDLRRIGMRGY